MEEKIFDIQRFAAQSESLVASGVKTTSIDNIIYTATNGSVNINVDSKTVTVTGNGSINISENIFQALTGYTFNINNAATINSITYTATNYPAQITYGDNHWFVTLNENCTVGNGSQSLGGLVITSSKPVTFNLHAEGGWEDTANVGGIRYASKSDGNVAINNNSVQLSGSVSLSKDLTGKTFTTSGTDTISFSVADNKSVTIDGTVYTVTDAAVISVTNKNITCAEGTFSIAPAQNNAVTINGITYTAQASGTSIKLDDGNITLDGKFNIALDANKSARINRFNLSANENVSFTFDSSDKNFVSNSSDALNIATSYGKSFKVNGVEVTDNGESGTLSLTKNATTLSGNYSVGSSSTSLSNKTFTIDGRHEIFFNSKTGTSNLKINDATFSATGNLELTAYFADNDVFKVDGTGVNVSGSGNFIFVSTDKVNINNVDFKSNTAYSNIRVNANSEVTLNNVYTVGDGSQNLNGLTINANSVIKGSTFKLGTNDQINIGGIDYSGDGSITFAEDNENSVTLSNGNVVVSLDKNESITINGTAYQATNTATVTYNNGTVSLGGDIAIESGNEQTTYTFTENSNSITVDGVKFSASDKSSTVTFDGAENSSDKTKISISGTVTVELSDNNLNITDYQFSLTQNSTAQIDGITFIKTGNTSKDDDIVFTAENKVTLNSNFTIGDETQTLNGLEFTLAEGVEAIFKFGSGTQSSGSSGDVVYINNITINGVDFSGDTGTVTVTPNSEENPSSYTVALSGGDINVSGDVSNITQFTLSSGNSYTFGKTIINPSSEVVISGISGTLSADTILSSVNIGGNTFSLTAGAGYTLNLDSNNKVSSIETSGIGSFTIDNTTFNITQGTVTFNLDSDSKISTVTSNNATISVNNAEPVTLTNAHNTLQQYGNTWATAPPYSSYIINESNIYGIYDGTSYTLDSNYSDAYFTNTSTSATLTGDKTLTVDKAMTVVSNGKTYTVGTNSKGTFNGNDSDGITSVDNGTITATATTGSIGVDLKDNTVLKSGNYTYTETETSSTSATITVDSANGSVTASSGTIKKSFGSGTTFNFKDETYTATDSTVFEVSQTHADGTHLISGGGERSVNANTTFNFSDDTHTYTAQSGAKYVAKGDSSGGYTAFSGTALYTESGGNFTDTANKTYSISGNATYQLTGKGLKENNTSTELKTATGTRAFTTGDSEEKVYLGDTYNVTGGTYQLTVSDGTAGTKSLTAGSATRTANATNNEHFHYGSSTRDYVATSDTTIKISFGGNDNPTVYEKSGGGTRNADGTDSTAYKNDTYILDNTAKVLLTLSDGNETFDSGTAQYTAVSGSKFHTNEGTEYTATSATAKLTLTKNSGGTSTSLTEGSGLRADSADNFTHNEKSYTSSGNVTYILDTTGESVYKASGSRDFVTEGENKDSFTTTYNGDEYTATDGTYSINVTSGTGTETLSSANATYSTDDGTFHYENQTYTAVSETTFKASISNGAITSLTEASGAGTRSATGESTTYDNYTYTLNSGAIKKIEITDLNNSSEEFYNGSATRTTTSTFKVSGNANTYNAYNGNATLTLTKSEGGTESVKLTSGSGTREQETTTFVYNDITYTNTAANVTYALDTANQTAENLFSAQGTRDYGGNIPYNGDTYTTTGIYSFNLNNGTSSENLSASGIYSAGDNEIFHFDDETYQGFEGGATLTISYDGNNITRTDASGKGTRTLENETFTHTSDGNTYNVNQGAIIEVDLEDNSATETFYSGTATQTYAQDSGVFHFNDYDYTAQNNNATLTLIKSAGNETSLTLTGSGTRTDSATTFTTSDLTGTYTRTSSNIAYQIAGSESEKVYSATGTRDFGSGDSFTTTFKGDTYTATSGKYSATVTEGNGTSTLSSGSATYNLNSGTFHYENNGTVQTYTAVSETTLTISLENDAAKALTDANGTATRPAVAADSSITYGYQSDTYNTGAGSTLKAVISGPTTVTEELWKGTATYTAQADNNGKFHYNNLEYTAVSDTTLTVNVNVGNVTSKTFGANSAGTRSDSADTFTYKDNAYIFHRISDDITYLATGSGSDLTENVYAAIGTRTDVTDETHTGDWGNSYQLNAGLRTVTVTNGSANDVLTGASASNVYYGSNTDTFTYNGTIYTATNYNATLNLNIANNTGTESFVSGSGKNATGYIVRGGSKVDIDGVTYTAAADSVATVTGSTAITGISGGTITGNFSNKSATIGDIVYSGTGNLKVTNTDTFTAESGTFNATGNFSTARTINGSRTLNITGDTEVKVTFSTGDVTKIENLNNGATVVNAGGAVTAIADENGTYTFGSQKIVVANDSANGLTFTLDTNGIATKIEGLDRADDGEYITLDITETNNTPYSVTIRTSGTNELSRNADGSWTEPTFTIDSYIVTYSDTFKVQAVSNNAVITLTETDYSVNTETNTLNITNQANVNIVVMNQSTETITIGNSHIGNTGSNAAQIDTEGNLHIGKQNEDGTFEESEDIPEFNVSVEGEVSISDDGTITVAAKNESVPVTINITDTSKASLDIGNNGTFEVNGKSSVEVTGHTGEPVQLIFDEDGGISGFEIPATGSGTITITDIDDIIDLGSSADLPEYSLKTYTLKIPNVTPTINVDVINNSTKASFSYADGQITGIANLNNDAMIKFSDMSGISSSLSINNQSVEKGTDSSGNLLSANVVAQERIRFNSTNKKWTCGLAQAQSGTYTVEIDSTGEIVLKSGSTQTKNVNDYKAVFGSSTSYKPDYDDDVLPKYNSNISLESGKVSELKISPPGSKEYTINSKTLTLTGETTIKATASNNFANSVEINLKNGTSAIYNSMTFSGNNADTKITVPSSGAITLADKTKVTGTKSNQTFTASGEIIFDGITVKDLSANTAITAVDTSTSKLTIGGKALNVTGDSQYTVSAGTGKYIKGVNGDATVSGTFITTAGQNVSIVTDSAGTFKIGSKDYFIGGDNEVTLATTTNGSINTIKNLSASGSVTGDFSRAITVNSYPVKVTGDASVGVVGDSSKISQIYNVTNGANVSVAGGATLISTDGNGGQFKLGSKTYSLSAGVADFKSTASSGAPVITEIRNVSGGTSIKASQSETGLVIGNDTITVGNSNVIFQMGNGTISGVTGVNSGKKVNGLSNGATVQVTSGYDVNINGSDVQITSSTAPIVHAKKNAGYSSVTGIAAGSTITKAAKDAIIIPDAAGTFTFNGHTFKTESKPTFTMGNSNTVSAIGGVSGEIALYQSESGLQVLNDTITITGAGADGVTLVAGNGSVNQVKNLKGDVNGLNAGAIAEVKTTNAIKFNKNESNLSINDADGYTVRATSDGYDLVTGLTSGAVVTTAKNASLVATVTSGTTGEFTFDSTHKFGIYGDDTVTFMTDGNSKLKEIADVRDATISVYTDETGLKINGQEVNVKGTADKPVKIKVNGSGGISGFEDLQETANYSLPAGATLKVDASTNTLNINGKDLKITGDNDVTVRATSDGYDLVTGLSNDATVTAAKNASLVTDKTGEFTFNGHKFNIDGDSQVTLTTSNADSFSVSAIDGVNGASIGVYQTESGLAINGAKVTLGTPAANNAVTVNVGENGNILGVGGIDAAGTYSLPSDITIGVETTANIKINDKDVQIDGGSDDKYTVHSTSDGYDSVTGLTSGAIITKAKENSTLYSDGSTDNDETYNFGDKAFTAKGDATIGFVMGASNKLSSIIDLTGTVSGDFSNSVTVNNKTVNVTGDTAISIVGGGGTEGITKITNLTNGAVVNNAGGASTISIDGAGDFSFKTGTVTHKFGASHTASFLAAQSADYNPSITGIKDIDAGATIAVYQEEKALTVENDIVTITGASGDYPVSLAMGGDTISTVANLKGEIDGLSFGASVVTADGEVTINNAKLKITGGTSQTATVLARSISEGYGYGTIKGFAAGVTFAEAKNTSLVTNADGEYSFGSTNSHKFKIDNDSAVTLSTNIDSKVTAVGGIKNASLTVYQNEDSLLINDKTIKIGDVPANDNVVISIDGSGNETGNIVGIGNLKGSVDSLPSDVTINVVDSEASINGEKWKIDEGSSSANYTVVTATNGGYSTVKGIDQTSVTFTDAKHSSIVATRTAGTTASTYTFNNHKFAVSGNDTEITLSTDANSKVTALDDVKDATLAVYQNESFNINGRQINIGGLTDNAGSDSDAVSLKFDTSGNITEVGNLKGSISNLAENATIQIADSDVTINSVALKIKESGSTSFKVISKATGYDTITGIDTDATVAQAANVSIVANISDMTSTSHKFYFGASATANMEIIGDSEVTISTDNNSDATAVGGFNGTLKSTADNLKINGVNIYNTDDNVSIIAATGVEHGISTIYGLADGKEVSVPAGTTVLYSVKSGEATKETKFTINGTAYNLLGDADTISITDRTIKGLDADARLTISAVGSFNVNTKNLELTTDKNIVIGEGENAARLYNPDDIDFGANTPVEDILTSVAGGTSSTITVGADTEASEINAGDKKAVVVMKDTTGTKTINLNGGKLALIKDTSAAINVSATGEADTIISSGANVQVTGNNKTRVMPTSDKTITYNSYDHSQSAGLQITNADVIAAVHDYALKFTSNASTITLPNNAVVTMNYVANKVGIVNFYNLQGEMQKVGYTYSGNDTINYAAGGDDMLLLGNWTIEGGGKRNVPSTLLGGSGNDTAFGGVGDYFDLGRGKNYLEISGGTGHATVEVSDKSGETTVKGFDNKIMVSDGDVVRVKTSETEAYYTNDGLMFVYGTSTLNIQDVSTASDNTLYAYANVLIANSADTNKTLVKTSVARENEAIKVAANVNDDDFTKAYVGHNSGVDFKDFNDYTININLSDGKGTLGNGATIAFRGITSLKGGDGDKDHTLIGSASDKNTLVAGNGEATIWGKGSSADLLIGNTDTTKKDASTTFFYTTGDGSDTISNFQFYNATVDASVNEKADKVSLGADVSSVTHSGNDLVIVVSGGDSLTVKDGVGKTFTISGSDGKEKSAVTGSTLTYAGDNAYYSATDSDAILTISSDFSADTLSINLSDTSKYSSNIAVIDAANCTVSNITLVGSNRADSTIKTGQNGSSVFGGEAGNDLIIAENGRGHNIFRYSSYNGNDTIQGYSTGDTIDLQGAMISQAKWYTPEAVANGLKLKTNSSNSLTIFFADGTTADNITFKLGDTTYTGWNNLKAGTADSADLAEDYWEVAQSNELLDGEVTFWAGNGISGDLATDYDNYLTDEICTGDIKFSIAPADTVYSFSDK